MNKKFQIARISHKGRDLLIVLFPPDFGKKPTSEKQKITQNLQNCAQKAEMEGRIIPVWDRSHGGLNFFGPPYFASYLSTLQLTYIKRFLKEELECDIEASTN